MKIDSQPQLITPSELIVTIITPIDSHNHAHHALAHSVNLVL